jgi:hypothetical protein
MKKMFFALMCLTLMCFVACDHREKTDDPQTEVGGDDNGAPATSPLVGIWNLSEVALSGDGDQTFDIDAVKVALTDGYIAVTADNNFTFSKIFDDVYNEGDTLTWDEVSTGFVKFNLGDDSVTGILTEDNQKLELGRENYVVFLISAIPAAD